MPRIAPVKTAAQAAAAYGANGGSSTAAANWANNFSADIPAILSAAAAAVGSWQDAVSTDQAAQNFTAGLNKAKGNAAAIAQKVQGVGKNSFSAGVKAASTGNYAQFAAAWQGAVTTQVAQLDRTNPRGDRSANRARQAAYDAWVDSQAGKFRVK